MFQKSFPEVRQHDQMDCGAACLKMIAEHFGQTYSLQFFRERSYLARDGVTLKGIAAGAESVGFRTMPVQIPLSRSKFGTQSGNADQNGLIDAPLPCVVHWEQEHFVVVYKITQKHVFISDPASGKRKLNHTSFRKKWETANGTGVALLLEPTPAFHESGEKEEIDKTGFRFLFSYLRPYRKLLVQLFIGLLVGSLLQLVFPFLTQSIVDIGIENQNIGFIWLILIAQLMIFFGQTTIQVLQSWILLHVSTRINVSLISDFLVKLMKLPIGFFDTKMIGDLLQRIGDHTRIESFLVVSSMNVLFSAINFVVFGIVLLIYNFNIFLVFLVGSLLYLIWIFLFLKRRRNIDHERFAELAANQNTLIELIQGMPEIKLQNSEQKRRRQWTNVQAKLFRANIRSLTVSTYQDTGAMAITQLKDILISFIAAKAVIEGQMTLGMMLAVQYIVGQLNVPLQNMIGFVRSAQDAKISLERLGEIHNRPAEVGEGKISLQKNVEHRLPRGDDATQKIASSPLGDDAQNGSFGLSIQNLNFRYNQLEEDVLKNINLTISAGKVTAIVGRSGSGKTTLVKLLLGFYEPQQGSIQLSNYVEHRLSIGDDATQKIASSPSRDDAQNEKINLNQIDKKSWRAACGAVLQDGYIFSDSIASNIAESDSKVDAEKLNFATQVANIQDFINDLPQGYHTKIGAQGNGISQGQRQRLLIARAVYKNPDFLFFDEATNALDAENEKVIVENLNQFFSGKTVIVVAHRLSTVKNADQIVVLEKGEIKEIGTHEELTKRKGIYFELVRNQLELGD